MLIVCPACASEYQIETDRVGSAGRSVRCASCRETWFITPDAVAAAQAAEAGFARDAFAQDAFGATDREAGEDVGTPAPVVDQPMPYARRPASPSSARRAGALQRFPPAIGPAIGVGLVLFVVLPLALLGRSTVVRAMPQSAGLYARIGLPVNLRGIDLRDVVSFQTAAEGAKPGELVVEGDLVGVARGRAPVPDLAVEVRDGNDQTIYRWSVAAPRAGLDPGETARLRASLSAPPAQARSVLVRFADAKPAGALRSEPAGVHEPAPAAPAEAHGSPTTAEPPHAQSH